MRSTYTKSNTRFFFKAQSRQQSKVILLNKYIIEAFNNYTFLNKKT